MATPIIVADFESALSTTIAVGGNSFSLSSVLDDDGIAIPGGLYYFTVDNSSSAKEYLTGTLSGNTVTGVKSVSRQGVETSGALRPHRVGAPIILTDFLTYKKYTDGTAVSGAPAATPILAGTARLSKTAANASDPVVVGDNDPRIAPNNYGTSSTLTDAYAITLASAPTAYVTGQQYTFKADVANTGTATLNVNALGAVQILRGDGSALADNDVAALQVVTVMYDGTISAFRLMSPRLGATIPTRQTFTASGTYTAPAGLKYVRVRLVGAGANGGNVTTSSGNTAGGPGGSPGGYSEKIISAATVGASQTVTVGTTAGTRTTSFGAIMSATGGSDVGTNNGSPGAAGIGTGGDVNTSGTPAQPGFGTSASYSAPSGAGGSTPFGTGGLGTSSANASGSGATGYGAGGGGGHAQASGGGGNGGAGTDGFVEVTEYYN